MLRGLLNILQNYLWETQTDYKVLVYTRVLALLSAMSQDSYLYHADRGTRKHAVVIRLIKVKSY